MRRIVTLVAALAVVSLLVAFSIAPSLAQTQEGLVNVGVVIEGNETVVQVPIGVAANVCGIEANVLATEFAGTDEVACEADADAIPSAFLDGQGQGQGKGKA